MTPAQAADHIRYMTRTNSTTFTDTEIINLGRLQSDFLSRKLLDPDENILLLPHLTDLQADVREYKLPDNILSRVRKVEAKFDGTNWIPLLSKDFHNITDPTDETNITTNYTNLENEAYYSIYRKSLYILSGTITDVTSGLKLWCMTHMAYIEDLTSTTDMAVDPSNTTHGMPKELHELWCRGIIIDYKQSREKPIPLTESEQLYKFDLQESINTLKRASLDRDVTGYLPPATARWNNGYNL